MRLIAPIPGVVDERKLRRDLLRSLGYAPEIRGLKHDLSIAELRQIREYREEEERRERAQETVELGLYEDLVMKLIVPIPGVKGRPEGYQAKVTVTGPVRATNEEAARDLEGMREAMGLPCCDACAREENPVSEKWYVELYDAETRRWYYHGVARLKSKKPSNSVLENELGRQLGVYAPRGADYVRRRDGQATIFEAGGHPIVRLTSQSYVDERLENAREREPRYYQRDPDWKRYYAMAKTLFQARLGKENGSHGEEVARLLRRRLPEGVSTRASFDAGEGEVARACAGGTPSEPPRQGPRLRGDRVRRRS